MKKDDRLYLLQIADCCGKIQQYTSAGKDVFFRDSKSRDAVLRNLQILAESAERVSSSTKDEHPEVDWRAVIGIRNILVHNYLGVSFEVIWGVVERDVPDLERNIRAIVGPAAGGLDKTS